MTNDLRQVILLCAKIANSSYLTKGQSKNDLKPRQNVETKLRPKRHSQSGIRKTLQNACILVRHALLNKSQFPKASLQDTYRNQTWILITGGGGGGDEVYTEWMPIRKDTFICKLLNG